MIHCKCRKLLYNSICLPCLHSPHVNVCVWMPCTYAQIVSLACYTFWAPLHVRVCSPYSEAFSEATDSGGTLSNRGTYLKILYLWASCICSVLRNSLNNYTPQGMKVTILQSPIFYLEYMCYRSEHKFSLLSKKSVDTDFFLLLIHHCSYVSRHNCIMEHI